MKPLIKKLVEAYGPSGHEGEIRELIRAEIKAVPDYISVDPLGNMFAVIKKRAKAGKKVLLSAHMDEIGVIVSHVDENGFARFMPIGGVSPLTCLGNRVRFADGAVGVIGIEHREDTSKPPTFRQLYIDFGAPDRARCPVKLGHAGVFVRDFEDLGDRIVAKSLDDRVGVAILVETMRQIKRTPHEVQFVFSVQEEVGLRGAHTSAYGLDPDLGIAVDVTRTGDTPKGLKMDVALGKGPAIKVRDSGMLADPRIVALMTQRAAELHLPHQMEVLEAGTTDAAAIQLARSGVPSGCLSIPCRHIHTPSEMVDYGDVEKSVALLLDILSKPIEL